MATSGHRKDVESDAELALTAEQEAELDRRWSAYLANPDAAISWDEVRRMLPGQE